MVPRFILRTREDFLGIFLGESDVKEVVGRIKARIDRYLEMGSSSNQVGEFERMMIIFEQRCKRGEGRRTRYGGRGSI